MDFQHDDDVASNKNANSNSDLAPQIDSYAAPPAKDPHIPTNFQQRIIKSFTISRKKRKSEDLIVEEIENNNNNSAISESDVLER
ncbi:unnamed protein product [Lasius platythorax]|uniref:Uncharacterized protein n=1 Tax=Lasius platythorax TaxID=488582 RepID=A0AAV2MW97_9HYME